jgi:hypothetical protein
MGWTAAALERARIKTFPRVRGLPTSELRLLLSDQSPRVRKYPARALETYNGRFEKSHWATRPGAERTGPC